MDDLRSDALAYAACLRFTGAASARFGLPYPPCDPPNASAAVLDLYLTGNVITYPGEVARPVEKQAKLRARGAQDGRRRLVDSAREIFRLRIRLDVSRLDIARHAGVAPGLVTYHFPSNAALVFAVAKPFLTEAIDRLFTSLDSHHAAEERLKQTAILFMNFARMEPLQGGHRHEATLDQRRVRYKESEPWRGMRKAASVADWQQAAG